MSDLAGAVLLAGRILIAAYFAYYGLGHLRGSRGFVDRVRSRGRLPVPALAGWPAGVWLWARGSPWFWSRPCSACRPVHSPRSCRLTEEAQVAWIEIVDEPESSGRLRDLYDGMVDPEYGRVDTILRIHSLHPEGLRTHHELYREVMTGTPTLRKVEREMIALVVSVINECHY